MIKVIIFVLLVVALILISYLGSTRAKNMFISKRSVQRQVRDDRARPGLELGENIDWVWQIPPKSQ